MISWPASAFGVAVRVMWSVAAVIWPCMTRAAPTRSSITATTTPKPPKSFVRSERFRTVDIECLPGRESREVGADKPLFG